MKRKEILAYLFGAFIVIAAVTQIIYRWHFSNKYSACAKAWSIGEVFSTRYKDLKTTGLWVEYTYVVNGQSFDGETNIGTDYEYVFKEAMLNMSFPVLYCHEKPNISSIIITPEQYVGEGLGFPDSLKWTGRYRLK